MESYRPPKTFFGVPYTRDLTEARAAIVGIPFDCGIHTFRIGSREGPASVREQTRLIRTFNPDYADYDARRQLHLVDIGDLDLVPSKIEQSFSSIEAAIFDIHSAGTIPIAIGGDGSISYPILKATSRAHNELVLLHIDAHTDTTSPTNESPHNAGTQFYRSAVDGLIDASRSFHVGIRGTTYAPKGLQRTRGLGYNVISMIQLIDEGIDRTIEDIKEVIGDRPTYLCWDMDVFDPSCAPGVCAPSWGGLSAREGIQLCRQLAGLNIVAADVNTVSPNHDINGMTAFLAAALVQEILIVLCKNAELHVHHPESQVSVE